MVDLASSSGFPHFALAVDLTNSQTIVVAWSNVDAVNADLRCWTVTEAAIVEVTNVVLNSVDDQGLAGISIDTATGAWYVFYAGASDGSETFDLATRSLNIYYKVSTDSGTTWGAETKISFSPAVVTWLCSAPRFTGDFFVAWIEQLNGSNLLMCSQEVGGGGLATPLFGGGVL